MRRGGGVSGAVSLVMIFCVLCLAVFSVLTLSTAVRERDLSELTAQRAREYYEADRKAVETLAALAEGRETDVDVTYSGTGDGTQVDFGVDAGGTQTLVVSAVYTEDGWRILTWKTVYTADWEMDTTITLWDGSGTAF